MTTPMAETRSAEPMDFELSEGARVRLQLGLDALAGVLGMGRIRAITRDIFVRNLSDSEVRRRLANTAMVATELTSALRVAATRGRTLAVLARITEEAWQSSAVDDRVRSSLQGARDALHTADMPRYHRELALLDDLSSRAPSELLDRRSLLLAFASRNGERLLNALERGGNVERSEPEEGHSPRGGIAPGGEPSPASAVGAEELAAPAALPSVEPGLAPVLPTLVGPTDLSAPEARTLPKSDASSSLLPASGRTGRRDGELKRPAVGPDAALAAFVRRVEAERARLEGMAQESITVALGPDRLRVAWRLAVDEALGRLEAAQDGTATRAALSALEDAARSSALALDGLVATEVKRAQRAAAALAEQCDGGPVDGVLHALEILASELGNLPQNAPIEALRKRFDAPGSLASRGTAVLAQVREWREEAEKQQRIEELRRQLAELTGSLVPSAPPGQEGALAAGGLPVTSGEVPERPAAFAESAARRPASGHGIVFRTVDSFPPSFPRYAFLTTVKPSGGVVATRVLPLDPGVGAIPPTGRPLDRTNAAAAWVLRVCREEVVHGSASLSTYLTVFDDVSLLIKDGSDPAGLALLIAVSGLLLLAGSDYPPRARRRLADALVRADDEESLVKTFLEILGNAGQPTLAAVLSRLLTLGHHRELVALTKRVCDARPACSRGWSEALGVALSVLPPAARDDVFTTARMAADLGEVEGEAIERWLDHVGPRRPVRPLEVDRPAWLVDTLGRYADCEYETSDRGDASVNASVPSRVREAGIYLPQGGEKAVLPILVRNAGQRGAAAVEVRLATTGSSGCSLPAESRHAYVRWIGRDGLEPPHDAILEVQVEIPADTQPRELKLNAYVRWAGASKESSRDLVYNVTPDPPAPAYANVPVEGVRGSPMDLNDPKVLERSSRTVRDCLAALLADLRRGEPVRAMVYGRRRRGKSSIRRTLAADPTIARHFVVRDNTWNSAAISTVRFGFEHLGALIRDALLDRVEDVPPFAPRDGANRDELSAAWQAWLRDVSNRLRERARVLLLLDEFQKWLSGLPDRADRLVLLDAFRAFNDTSATRLEVSYVLFGLQNLMRFHKESIDFAAAVKPWPVRPFTLEESKRYVQQCLPQAHDDRVRRRLHVLSGGNPFVLNIFCQQLATRASNADRGYCLPSDVEALLDDLVDERVEAVFAYMLREDEEENAPSLIQLTTLRAVAGRLHETGSHDGWVRIEGVEDWLRRRSVVFDDGLPQEHLAQLHELGILERHADGLRYALPGEAICRWLAGEDESRVPLQPVTHRRDTNLVLNRYRQVRQLAQGGQATTWLAENVEEGGHRVVLKIYHEARGDMREQVAREGQMLGRVRSPYVIQCQSHAVDERKGGVLVLEWADGQSLGDMLRERPPAATSILPGGTVAAQVELMKKLATGVAAVHDARVVHKDLKPQNIMLVEASGVFVPKIIDFGIAGEEPAGEGGMTQSVFTWRYLAPEKRRDQSLPRGCAADIYSLGMVFLDVLVGPAPEDAGQLVGALPSALPSKLRALVGDMVADEPAARPTAQAVLSRLDGVFEPGGWIELVERADAAYVEERHDEAVGLYERALGESPPSDRASNRFAAAVGDLCALLAANPCMVQWWGALVDAGLDALASGHAAPVLASQLFDALRNCPGSASAPPRWDAVMDALDRRPAMSGNWVSFFEFLLSDATIARHHGDRVFELALRFREANLLATARIANFCAQAAEVHRCSAASAAVVETWLRRGRRIHPQPTEALAAEMKAFESLLQRTEARASLPPNCERQDLTVVGQGERGHVELARIERFARRLLEMHPYVCAVKRKRKDGDLSVPVPRLLDDVNLAQHRVDGIDDACIIPFALDGSFTAEGVPIRMNIVLPKGTTASQRKVAREAIAANAQLFG